MKRLFRPFVVAGLLAFSVSAQVATSRASGGIGEPALFPEPPLPASREAPIVEPPPTPRGRGFDVDADRMSRDLAKRTRAVVPTPEERRENVSLLFILAVFAVFVLALGAFLLRRRRG